MKFANRIAVLKREISYSKLQETTCNLKRLRKFDFTQIVKYCLQQLQFALGQEAPMCPQVFVIVVNTWHDYA